MASDEELDDAAALARVREALGVRPIEAKKTTATKVRRNPAPRKAAAKKPAKKAPPKKPARNSREIDATVVPPEIAEPPGTLAEPAEVAVYEDLDSPALRASRLRIQGMGWEEIAQRTGYQSGDTVAAAVALYLQRSALGRGADTAKAHAMIAVEVDESIKNAFFDRAMQGDKDAAMVVLTANRDYFKHSGLERADFTINSKQTLIIGGGADMAEQLKAAVLEREARQRAEAEELEILEAEMVYE